MDSYQFYKSLYDRELNRRKDLDAAINLPITILTVLVAANSYLIGKENALEQEWMFDITNILLLILILSFVGSIFYLIRSYNNLFKGFAYRNLGFTEEIRNYEMHEIPKYNNQVDDKEKLSFEDIIIEKLTQYTDIHIVFNDQRSLDLHRAKTFIIMTLVMTGIKFLILAINYLTI